MSLVDANIPCLIGRDHMRKWGGKLDFRNNTFTINDKIKMKLNVNDKGHYEVDLFNNEAEVMKISNTLFNINDEKDMLKVIDKIHKVTAHKGVETIQRFVRNSNFYNKHCDSIVKEVVKSCKICQKFRKTPEKPQVALPKATDVNVIVALDLKQLFSEKKYILYLCDEMSKFIKGTVISIMTRSPPSSTDTTGPATSASKMILTRE